jgi:hypothetical protein
VRVICIPEDNRCGDALATVAASAARRLKLAPRLAELILCLDDIADDPRPWIALRRADRRRGRRWRATIYLHPDGITRDRPGRVSLGPGRQVWDPAVAPPEVAAAEPRDFRRRKAERALFHQLLWLADLIDGAVVPEELPRALGEAFQAGWSVTVDGRLRRRHLPGYAIAHRRASFSRLFSQAGVLLPEHWRIFHRLWEGEVADQEAVLAHVSRLPRLQWRHG